jgi:hypothetical protein
MGACESVEDAHVCRVDTTSCVTQTNQLQLLQAHVCRVDTTSCVTRMNQLQLLQAHVCRVDTTCVTWMN